MFFNYWVGFFQETYLFLAVCVGLNLLYLKWGAYGEGFNSLLSIIFGALIIAYPLFVVVFYNLKKNQVNILAADEEFFDRYGSAVKDLNFKRQGRLVLLHTFLVLVRKLWLAHIVLL